MQSKNKHFEALVKTFSSELYRFGYGLCHNTAQAEDLVQETFYVPGNPTGHSSTWYRHQCGSTDTKKTVK